ncbi:diaminopimelate decarboxylase [bacterium]|nr:diaminopimelate decarboxylase [candidate division CSSED10-310 bacterium]
MNNKHPYEAPAFERVPVKAWNTLSPQTQQGYQRATIDGVEIHPLVEHYGSPLVIISERLLRRRYREMAAAFQAHYPDTIIAWSYKTNYLSSICSVFRTEGAWAEVVSGFEYGIARDLGIPGQEIIFNGPHKTDEELFQAMGADARVNADSFEELEQLKAVARKLDRRLEIGIRVNVRLNYPPWSKFGFSYEDGQAYEAIRVAELGGFLKVVRLHLHAGTYITDTTVYSDAMEKLLTLALKLEATSDFELKELDLGGGYASVNTLHAQFLPGEAISPTYAQYAETICEPLLRNLPRLKRHPRLFIEPGRAIVDEAVSLVTTVVASKHLPNGNRALLVDAGVNILPTAYWYKHEMVALTAGPAPEETVSVLGGLCMNIDVLRTDVRLPAVQRGDLLLIRNTGAYNFSQSMQFIYTRPSYIMISDGAAHCVREAEDGAYVRARERLPAHLVNDETRGSLLVKNPAD